MEKYGFAYWILDGFAYWVMDGFAYWVCSSASSYESKLPTSSRETASIDKIYHFSKKVLTLLAYVHFL